MPAVTATILSDGTAMDPAYHLVGLDIRREIGRIPTAELRVLDGDAALRKFAISDSKFFAPGAKLEIKLRYEGKADQSVFTGLVVRHGVEVTSEGSILLVGCKDAAVKLTAGRRSAVFAKMTDSAIIKKLLQAAGVTAGTIADSDPTHPEMVQYRCTSWDFILARAEALGLLVVVEDGKLSLHKIAVSGSAKHKFDYGLSEIYDLEIEADAGDQPEGVEGYAWDPKKLALTPASKAASTSVSPGNLDGKKLGGAVGNGTRTLSHPVPLVAKELQAWADADLLRSRLGLLRGRLAIPGSGDLALLDVMSVAGVGERFNGKTLVTGLRHRLDGLGWRTDVQFGLSPERFAHKPDVQEAPAAGLLPAVSGLQIGMVDSFLDDPDKELRVKVILPGLDAQTPTAVWARLAAPDAGKERGYFFRPEVGDEVVVGFFNNDPRCPVILGSLFGSKNGFPKALGPPDAKNQKKGIVTKKGTTIGFVDGDKAKVFIETAQKQKLLLDDDAESIVLSDKHGNSITMSKDGIVLKSASAFTIDAAKDVQIKGSKVDIK